MKMDSWIFVPVSFLDGDPFQRLLLLVLGSCILHYFDLARLRWSPYSPKRPFDFSGILHVTPNLMQPQHFHLILSLFVVRGHKLLPWTHLSQRDLTAENVHPRNLTWNLKIMVSKWTFLFQGLIFRFHVKFRGVTQFNKSLTFNRGPKYCHG